MVYSFVRVLMAYFISGSRPTQLFSPSSCYESKQQIVILRLSKLWSICLSPFIFKWRRLCWWNSKSSRSSKIFACNDVHKMFQWSWDKHKAQPVANIPTCSIYYSVLNLLQMSCLSIVINFEEIIAFEYIRLFIVCLVAFIVN